MNIIKYILAVVLFLFGNIVKHEIESDHLKCNYFTTSDGVQLHYLEAGSGPTLLFVPGFTIPAEIWNAQIEYFSSDYRVISLDPRSQGKSDKPSYGHHFTRRGQDIGELIDHLDTGPVIAITWSMSVLELLTQIHEAGSGDYRGIIMVDMFFGSDQGPDETHPAESMITSWIEQLQYDRESWTPGWVRDLFRSQPSEQFLEELTNTVLQMPTNSAVTLLASQLLIEERNFQNHLAGLDMPTMFIASDATWAVSEAEMIRESLPDIRVEVIQHTGHALFVDEPELFNRILENFILSIN